GEFADIERPIEKRAVGLEVRTAHTRTVDADETRVEAPRRRLGESSLQPGARPAVKVKNRLAVRHAVFAEREPPPVSECNLPQLPDHQMSFSRKGGERRRPHSPLSQEPTLNLLS